MALKLFKKERDNQIDASHSSLEHILCAQCRVQTFKLEKIELIQSSLVAALGTRMSIWPPPAVAWGGHPHNQNHHPTPASTPAPIHPCHLLYHWRNHIKPRTSDFFIPYQLRWCHNNGNGDVSNVIGQSTIGLVVIQACNKENIKVMLCWQYMQWNLWFSSIEGH